jgi:hypothetical protein
MTHQRINHILTIFNEKWYLIGSAKTEVGAETIKKKALSEGHRSEIKVYKQKVNGVTVWGAYSKEPHAHKRTGVKKI